MVSSLKSWFQRGWRTLFVISLLLNLALVGVGILLQPILTAAQVAAEVAATKTAMRALETRKVAEIKKQAAISERQAVAKAVAKERFEQEAKRAALVASAVASAKAKIEAEKKSAVKQAVAKEKAKARVGRIAVAVPVLGTGVAAGFEYADYKRWKEANPEKSFRVYADHSLQEINALAEEVMNSIPALVRINTVRIVTRYQIIIKKMK